MTEIFPSDLLLFELARGEQTNPPPEIVRELENKGFVEMTANGPALTVAGAERAEAIKGCEHDLRLQCVNAANGRPGIMTGGGRSSLHIDGGGPARIKT